MALIRPFPFSPERLDDKKPQEKRKEYSFFHAEYRLYIGNRHKKGVTERNVSFPSLSGAVSFPLVSA
jgi:hypothetical protein